MGKIHYFAKLDTTMLEAKKYIVSGVECPYIIIAGEQSQGRGRYGRIWFSPKGNLYMTVIQPITHVPEQIPLIVSVAVAQALIQLVTHHPRESRGSDNRSNLMTPEFCQDGNTVAIKPPNDILINGRKIAGILIEEHDPFYSIGMGINVASSPLIQSYETTFLHKYNKNIGLGFLFRFFLKRYYVLLAQDFTFTQDQYNKLSLC